MAGGTATAAAGPSDGDLANLMMAWYFSGYYTGYYQARTVLGRCGEVKTDR